jgi:hypothetical protein
MDELVHVKLEGQMAELLARVDPEKYREFIVIKNSKPVLYVELAKALYGTLQAVFLFWENLTGFLVKELRFTVNKYNRCVANKIINGNQFTICWHVDDLKMSHVDATVLEEIVHKLDEKYRSEEAPVTVTHGKFMTILA